MATKKAVKKQSPKKPQEESPKENLITVFIMGKAHNVPAEATIMGAMEYAGYQIKEEPAAVKVFVAHVLRSIGCQAIIKYTQDSLAQPWSRRVCG